VLRVRAKLEGVEAGEGEPQSVEAQVGGTGAGGVMAGVLM
jgi:hypothetical protein